MIPDTRSERPAGFNWQELPEIGSRILMPDYWYTQRVVTNFPGSFAHIRITRENPKRPPKTMLSISAFDRGIDPNKVTIETARELAAPAQNLLTDTKQISLRDDEDFAGLEQTGIRNVNYQMPEVAKKLIGQLTLRVEPNFRHFRYEVSKKTGVIYIVSFECPSDKVDHDYEIGKKMLSSLVLNPNIGAKK